MSIEEQAIEALPPKLQQRMAVLCLAGWRFRYNDSVVRTMGVTFGNEWWAHRVGTDYFGSTLCSVLMQMDCEYCHDLHHEVAR